MPVRVRYAPSPTGSPHVGNIRTAIFDWLFARKMGGDFIARLEDTDRDPERYKPEFVGDIEESLRFLGIEPDEWWVGGGPSAPYLQSERLDRYREIAQRLIDEGKAYRCYCTREELQKLREEQQARGLPTGYDRRHRYLTQEDRERYEAQGRSSVVRLAVPLEGKTEIEDVVYGSVTYENRVVEDVVLLKSNGWPTYHLAAIVDDHDMGITHVIRGEDWLPSFPQHVLLYRALGWDQPVWVHVPLIVGTDRKKLSKRHGATRVLEFRDEGYLPEALFNFLVLLGWSAGSENREVFSRDELIERFSLEGISRNPAVFDYEKLKWMNAEYLRKLEPSKLLDLCAPFLEQEGLLPSGASEEEREYAANVLSLAADRMRVLRDAPEVSRYFFADPAEPEEKGRRKWLTGDEARERLEACANAFDRIGAHLTAESVEAAVDEVAEQLGIARGPVIHTLRVAVTGRTVGPGIFELLALLGKDAVLRRLRAASGWIQESAPLAGQE